VLQRRGGLDLDHEPLGAEHGGQLGPQHLEGHLAIVAEVLGEVDGGHAAGAQLALDAVAVGEGSAEALDGVCQLDRPVAARLELWRETDVVI